jgi:hypothetical protein
MKKIFTLLLALALFVSACGANPDEPVSSDPNSTDMPSNDYSPQPEDENLLRSEAYIDSSELLILESYPLQFTLNLKGNLPTPCHQLRVSASAPDAENKIYVDVYSVADANKVCDQVLSPFEANVSLGSFATGHYALFVNGSQVAEFDV